MHTIWFSLVWKEWHEHKWKLVSMVAILCGAAAIILKFTGGQDLFALAVSFVGICMVPLAMFIGLGAAVNERSRNTLPFLQSLPAPMWRIALVKVVLGLVTLTASIILAVAFIYAWKFVSDFFGYSTTAAIRQLEIGSITGRWYLDCIVLLLPFAVGLFTWSAATGVNRKDEVSAGSLAAAIFVGWLAFLAIAFAVSMYWINRQHVSGLADRWKWLAAIGLSTLPGGYFPATEISRQEPSISYAYSFATVAITNLLLLTHYVRRFGNLPNVEAYSPQVAARSSVQLDWLASPRRSAITAIAWKQFRESGPIALAGIGGSVGITLVIVIASAFDNADTIPGLFGRVYTVMAVIFGFLVALVVGIGVCLNDTNPKINDFWRSRPIHADVWFWIKFATGLIVVLVATYAPLVILTMLRIPLRGPWSSDDFYSLLPMQLAVFAAAVVTTCLVRQAVYAAILSIAVVYLGTLFGLFLCSLQAWLQTGTLRSNLLANPTSLQVAFGAMLSFLVSTILAWLAMRNNWGKKSRY